LRHAATQARVTAHALHHLGLHTVGLIIANSARRQAHQRRHHPRRRAVADPVSPGRLRRVEVWNPRPGTARFHFERAQLEVAFLANDVVRVSWGPGPVPVPYALAGEAPWAVPDVQAHPIDALRDDGPWVMRSDALEVTVSPDGSMRTARPGGALLRRESAPGRRGTAWEQTFAMRPGEGLSGLGEQAAGVDLRGGTYRLWNRDPGGSWGPGESPMYLGIPVLLATHGDGAVLTFYENSTDATFRLGDGGDDGAGPGTATVTFAGGVLRRYLAAGPVPHVLDRYSELTGRPALPPRWALGYHQSRWGYRCEADVRAITDGYAQLEVPLSALHLDIDYMRGFRVFTVDPDRFPDLGGLARHAAGGGTRVVTIVDPGVKVDPAYDVYREGRDQHRFCTDEGGHVVEGVVWPGRSVFPDFTDPATRSWWAGKYRLLTEAGVAGIWHDMNEPTSISLLGDPTLPTTTRHHFEGRGGDHGEGHNLYGLLMNRAGFEGLRAARGDRRPFVVSRSGWAGMQRWAWNWTGDASSTWESLRQQVATIVGLGLSGLPYSGSDIGGFSGIPDDELYLRWLQMSVFMPYCRTHSVRGVPPREPWCFDEPTRGVMTAWIRFRYRLLPYLYTLAHQAAETGAPLIRPPWWPLPDAAPPDAAPPHAAPGAPVAAPAVTGRGADDTFLLGDALLVAPVTTPGGRTRVVELPPGYWTSVWADDSPVPPGPGDDGDDDAGGAEGAGGARWAAPIDRIPVLARAGAVVPLDDGWAETAGPCRLDADVPPDGRPHRPALALDHAPRLPAFHCWVDAGGSAAGLGVDDAGDGDGPVRRDELRVEGAVPGGTALVSWERSGDFAPPASVRIVLHGLEAARAVADGTVLAVRGSTVDCPPFAELTLEGLRRPAPRGG
jgi:alpha-glucosidase